ncbi:hypothetical protein ABB02_01573 [Clostridiaceae bacterium JG1575]|nr:hypothetical protein ABB02_01573 [Clostridiaceae bacterium JG1575]
MTQCIVCGKAGDKHHVIHKAEGGLDTPLNIIYLCPEHHRGPLGPHRNEEVDQGYKKEMQQRLEQLFSKKYYSALEIRGLSQLSHSMMKKFIKSTHRYKEGYQREDIIFFLMGGNCYRYEEPLMLQLAEQF